MSGAIEYYEQHALEFARQVSDPEANSFEFDRNMPDLINLTDSVDGYILDFGCGAGNFTQSLIRKDRYVSGCDTSPTLLNYARVHHPNINKFFVWNGIDKCPEATKYDLIMAKLVFHYIPQLGRVLDNLSLALNSEGYLCFSVPHPDKTKLLAETDTDETIFTDEIGNFGLRLEMLHRTRQRYIELLKEVGLITVNESNIVIANKSKRLNILAKKS